MKRVLRKGHPNLFEVVEILKKEQAASEVAIEQLLEGEGLDLSEKKYNMKIPSRDLKQNLPPELDH